MEQVFSNSLIMKKIIVQLLDGDKFSPKKLGHFTKLWYDVIFHNKEPQHCLTLLAEEMKCDEDDVQNCQLSHALSMCSILNLENFEITLTLPKTFSSFAQVLKNNAKLFSSGKLKTLSITGSGVDMDFGEKNLEDIDQLMDALMSMNDMEKVVFTISGVPSWIIRELRWANTKYLEKLRRQHIQRVVKLVKENKFNRIYKQLPPQYKLKPSTVFSLSGEYFVLDFDNRFYIPTLQSKEVLKP